MESAASWWVTSALLRPMLCWSIFTGLNVVVQWNLHCQAQYIPIVTEFLQCSPMALLIAFVNSCTVLVNV